MKQLAASNHLIVHLDKGVVTPTGGTIMAMLMDDGSIFAYNGNHWQRTGNEPANAAGVAAGPGGYWCLNRDGDVFQWNEKPDDSRWAKDSVARNVTTLSCDSQGNLWCTNKDGELFRKKVEPAGLGVDKMWRMAGWEEVHLAGAWFMGQGKSWNYTVKSGDGLMRIVRDQYGIREEAALEAKVAEITKMNGLPSPDRIEVGQTLQMPPRD